MQVVVYTALITIEYVLVETIAIYASACMER